MNERIIELVKQAGGHWNYGDRNLPNVVEFQETDIPKFVGLIVQECGKVAYEETGHFPKPCDWLLDKFKRHFGVKE